MSGNAASELVSGSYFTLVNQRERDMGCKAGKTRLKTLQSIAHVSPAHPNPCNW